MKQVLTPITYWEKGDRVITYAGAATVLEDEEIPLTPCSFEVYHRGQVRVRLDSSLSEFGGRLEVEMEPDYFRPETDDD